MAASIRIVSRSIMPRIGKGQAPQPIEISRKDRRRDNPTREERLYDIVRLHPEMSVRVVW